MTNTSTALHDHKFSHYEGTALTALFMSDALIMAGKYSPAGIHSWISTISGALISSALLIIAGKHFIRFCYKPFSAAVTIALSASAIAVSLILFADFINRCVLPDINPFIIPLGIIATGIYTAFKNFRTLIKSVHMIIPVILFFILFIIVLLIPSVETEYMLSVSETFSISGFLYALAGDISVFFIKGLIIISLFDHEYQHTKNTGAYQAHPPHKHVPHFGKSYDHTHFLKTAVAGIISYGIIISALQLISLSVLGPGLYEQLDYPLYYPPGLTLFGEYFERAEILTIVMFMASLVMKTGIYIRSIRINLTYIR